MTRRNDYGRTAFRQTFLCQMPLSDAQTFRRFGETIYHYGLEMSGYPPFSQTPHNRASLAAVLEDVEFLQDFLSETIDPPEECTSREHRLALVAETTSLKLAEIAAELRVALRRKPRDGGASD